MIDARTLSTKVDWDKLRIFNQVAWSGSLKKKTSDKLALSQSAISRHISGLEQTMGCQLFHRSPKGLLLTEQGVTLFDTTQEIFGRISHTLSTLKKQRYSCWTFKNCDYTIFATFWLSNHISKFLDQYPDIRLSHLISSEETDVLHDVADVAVRSAQTTQLRLIERNIMTSPCRIYASKYLETHGTLPERMN